MQAEVVKRALTGRWIIAPSSGRAHLDLGDRSSQSLRVNSEHIIVTACHAHIAADAQPVPENYDVRCSNCMRIERTGTLIKAKSERTVVPFDRNAARDVA
jgi:hypothetical protein